MSLAENLLNSMSTTTYGSTEATESAEPHIVIDSSRQMIVPNSLKTIAVTGDKDIETVTFDCIRYWDGHDFADFALYINITLPNGGAATSIPTDVVAYDDHISFTWTISRQFTSQAGRLTVAIEAVSVDAQGSVLYRWSSIPNGELTIVSGLSRGEIPEDDITEDVVSQVLQAANKTERLVGEASDTAAELGWALEALDELIGGRP